MATRDAAPGVTWYDRVWDPGRGGDSVFAPLSWRTGGRVLIKGDPFSAGKSPASDLDAMFAVILAMATLDGKPKCQFFLRTAQTSGLQRYMSVDPSALVTRWASAGDKGVRLDDGDVLFSEMIAGLTSSEWNQDRTARPGALGAFHHLSEVFPLPNLWMGAWAQTYLESKRRCAALLETPASRRWLSLDPLRGPVTVDPRLDWIHCGTDRGPRSRPLHPSWVVDLGFQRVPVFCDGFGEWAECGEAFNDHRYYGGRAFVSPAGGMVSLEHARMMGRYLEVEDHAGCKVLMERLRAEPLAKYRRDNSHKTLLRSHQRLPG